MDESCKISGIVYIEDDISGQVVSNGDINGTVNTTETISGQIVSNGDLGGIVHVEEVIGGKVISNGDLSGTVHVEEVIGGQVNFAGCEYHGVYDGTYELTPTRSTQILNTADLIMSENVVVNPIPQNYGLITWNGAILTVS